MISSRLLGSAALSILLTPTLVHAASSGNQEQEYQQVRRIALRDPKVRAAYEDADRRLEEKIIRIDPALASYVRHRPAGGMPAAPAERVNAPVAKSRPAPAAQPRQTHTVAKGDTLTSIATQHGITVGALKAANHNPDERHLAVGQVLAIPSRR